MSSLVRLVEQVYCPPRKNAAWSLAAFVGRDELRYFSYGRHALRAAFVAIGIRKGEAVLTPGFICRDLLSAIYSLGAVPLYYPVGRDLQMIGTPDDLPVARAIIAVNYFGFPQNLAPFNAYCDRTGAVLIEDNAHGLFSRDETGAALGARGMAGIFSLRKTVPLPNGAALLLNPGGRNWPLPSPILPSDANLSRAFRVKRGLRHLVPLVGVGLPRWVTGLERRLRKLRSGYEIAPPAPDAERVLPENAAPCRELMEMLAEVDVEQEIARRRELYLALDSLIRAAGGEPVFGRLPQHTSPYGFPFYCSESQVGKVKKMLSEIKLECHRWPDLPDEIAPQAPEYYKSVWLVNFVW